MNMVVTTGSGFAWSYSRLKNFETCPKRHYHYDIAKDVGDGNAFQFEGSDTHKAFELRVSKGKALPLPLVQHETLLARLMTMPGEIYAEQKLALTEDYQPCGWTDKRTWFRTVLDFCNINKNRASVIDYKTGKVTSDDTQMSLMSATIMHYMPKVERVRAMLMFINHNHVERAEYTQESLPEIWSEVLPRVAKLRMAVATQEFPPKPNGLCKRWCHVTSCPYHGRG
jgi:PD-(D/E)XK nuclease superfamily